MKVKIYELSQKIGQRSHKTCGHGCEITYQVILLQSLYIHIKNTKTNMKLIVDIYYIK